MVEMELNNQLVSMTNRSRKKRQNIL